MDTSSPQTNAVDSSAQSDVFKDNQFRLDAVQSRSALLVGDTAVFDLAGHFCATQAKCSHQQGPLNEGKLDGSTVTCPWHGSKFNVCPGAVWQGPAVDPLKTCRVAVDGEIGRITTA